MGQLLPFCRPKHQCNQPGRRQGSTISHEKGVYQQQALSQAQEQLCGCSRERTDRSHRWPQHRPTGSGQHHTPLMSLKTIWQLRAGDNNTLALCTVFMLIFKCVCDLVQEGTDELLCIFTRLSV